MAMFGRNEMEKGMKAEERAAKFFENNGYHVRDLRDDDYYRERDVDFKLYKWGEKDKLVEVKSSTTAAKTGKIIVEDILNVNKGKIGWLWYTEADYITVVSQEKMFMYKPSEMRQYITRVKEEYNKIELTDDIFAPNTSSVDYNYMAEVRQLEDPTFKGSMSQIYYVDFHKYAALGYYTREIIL